MKRKKIEIFRLKVENFELVTSHPPILPFSSDFSEVKVPWWRFWSMKFPKGVMVGPLKCKSKDCGLDFLVALWPDDSYDSKEAVSQKKSLLFRPILNWWTVSKNLEVDYHLKLVKGETEKYLFSWDSVPGDDNDKLIKFLRNDCDIDWAKNEDISKPNENTILISAGEDSAEIIMDEKKEKAILKISDGRTHDLKVKAENGQLNIYTEKIKKILLEVILDRFCDRLHIKKELYPLASFLFILIPFILFWILPTIALGGLSKLSHDYLLAVFFVLSFLMLTLLKRHCTVLRNALDLKKLPFLLSKQYVSSNFSKEAEASAKGWNSSQFLWSHCRWHFPYLAYKFHHEYSKHFL
jgi:hypothetical protein